MPFSLKNAPSEFQNIMNKIFTPYAEFISSYCSGKKLTLIRMVTRVQATLIRMVTRVQATGYPLRDFRNIQSIQQLSPLQIFPKSALRLEDTSSRKTPPLRHLRISLHPGNSGTFSIRAPTTNHP